MVASVLAADSLALAVDSCFDASQIASKIGRVNRLLSPALAPEYANREAGDFTAAGDQALFLLESLREGSNPPGVLRFDPQVFVEHLALRYEEDESLYRFVPDLEF